MSKQEEPMSDLESTMKNMGYYAGVAFGAGYLVTFLGVLALFSEILSKIPSASWQYMPSWVGLSLFFTFLGIVCGIALGISAIRSSGTIRDAGPELTYVTSTVSALALMVLFFGIAGIITATSYASFAAYGYVGIETPLGPSISAVAASILLLIGFRIYAQKPIESKLMGGILMMVSIVLVYFVAYAPLRNISSLLTYAPPLSLPPLPGPLLSEANLEAVSLLLATFASIVYAILMFREETSRFITGIIISFAAILFSIGLMQFNFSAVSTLVNLLSTPNLQLGSPWLILFGLLATGISGIVILVTSCLLLATSTKQILPAKVHVPAPPREKYCLKCGAKVPAEAIYCPKCGKKQTQD